MFLVAHVLLEGGDAALLIAGGLLGGVVLIAVTNAVRITSQIRRSAGTRLAEGVVLNSRFDDQAAHFSGPYLEQTVPYRAFTAVSVEGDWVFLRTKGVPQATVLPLALFPGPAIEKIRSVLGSLDERTRPKG
ncbi:hypothetical protein [Aeromicrobium sp.]|uniref:hypothetical protein n=1 Tax=Aeromicrobium sp. TaxID=1871063 RepID=UPI002FC97290